MHGGATADSFADAALWRLAERLFEKMEQLDPTYEEEWNELTDAGRGYYYFALKAVLVERADVLRVLKIDLTNDNVIGWHRDG